MQSHLWRTLFGSTGSRLHLNGLTSSAFWVAMRSSTDGSSLTFSVARIGRRDGLDIYLVVRLLKMALSHPQLRMPSTHKKCRGHGWLGDGVQWTGLVVKSELPYSMSECAHSLSIPKPFRAGRTAKEAFVRVQLSPSSDEIESDATRLRG
jgi:hypothetical protein